MIIHVGQGGYQNKLQNQKMNTLSLHNQHQFWPKFMFSCILQHFDDDNEF
jgi:hypothetical protein